LVVRGIWVVLGLLVVLAACSSTVDGEAKTGKVVELRRVLADGPGEIRAQDPVSKQELVLGPVEVRLDRFERVEAKVSEVGGWLVELDLPSDLAAKFGELTARSVGEQVAMLVDGGVVSAPSITSAITGGKIEISGKFTRKEAEDLAAALGGR
jgi:preprotein translocase subunit SecD